MQTHHSLDDLRLDGAWLTIGVYDGVHIGHQAILTELVSGAGAAGRPAVVVTFDPHPAAVLHPENAPRMLTTAGERAALLGELGVDHVVIQRFDLDLSRQTARDYAARLKDRTGLERLLVGYDFAMGRDRGGDVPALRALGAEIGFDLQVFDPVTNGETAVSSSRIRRTLSEGRVREAGRMLGRPYAVSGPVVTGAQRGRSIGIPTANVAVPAEKLVPAAGVYACRVTAGGSSFRAATNIGFRPTFEGGETVTTVEAHLLDFDGDLYNQVVEVAFVERLRDEMKFSGVEALVARIRADILQAREVLDEAVS
ncbi:MAG TPA: bifunctional riboflavin kinase/FAD synthetase [Anaerolineales bacterium]|nr:bifunctional riboflavin kinase/FAD synthetase [Anaerolineales bacterium]